MWIVNEKWKWKWKWTQIELNWIEFEGIVDFILLKRLMMNHFGMTGLDDYDDDDDWWLWWLLLCWWLWRQTKEKQKKAIEYVRWKNNFWNTWSNQIIQIRSDFFKISFCFPLCPFPLHQMMMIIMIRMFGLSIYPIYLMDMFLVMFHMKWNDFFLVQKFFLN